MERVVVSVEQGEQAQKPRTVSVRGSSEVPLEDCEGGNALRCLLSHTEGQRSVGLETQDPLGVSS